MSWLKEIVSQHKELESPQSFWYWAALASISAVVKDQVWLDKQIYSLYPNIYVMLHAESGLKKGPPIAMAKRLVQKVNNTRVISGRSSIQGILKELGTAYTEKGTGKIISKSVAFICSSELSSSIVEDKVATTILTDLYDRQYNVGEWRSLLKMESFNLKDPTITMLTATNEAHSSDFFGRKDVQGGYFARTFIIYEARGHNINSLIYPLHKTPNYDELAAYLKELTKLHGEFQPLAKMQRDDTYCYLKIKDGRRIYFSEPGKVYDDWYENFVMAIRREHIKDETGTLNRFGDSVLKVAMLLSLAESPNLVISIHHVDEAIKSCEKLVGNIRKATMTAAREDKKLAEKKALIIQELLERDTHAVSRQIMLKKYWMHFNAQEFDEVMQSFDASGMIITKSINNQIIYEMPEKQVTEMKNYLAGKASKT